ncbi:MAG: SurA N-terminal domain-containing protein [Christensenellaceae bacterium]|jgi:peptidyl-prolyl cis-trans isomerase D
MKQIKKIAALLVCAFALLALSSCGTTQSKVLATVNGHDITESDFNQMLEAIAENSYGVSAAEMEQMYPAEDYAAYKNNILDSLIQQELLYDKAREEGFADFSKEELDSLNSNVDSLVAQAKDSVYSQAASDMGSASVLALLEAEKQYQAYVKENNYSRDAIYDTLFENLLYEKYYNSVMDSFVLTDKDVEAVYNELLNEQQQLYKDDPEAAYNSFTQQSNDVTVFVPENAAGKTRYIKHILLQLPQDIQSEIALLEESGKHDDAAQTEQQARATLKEEADRIYSLLQQGEDFEALVAEFSEGGLALQNVGDISEPIESEYGYHILKYQSAPAAGAIPLEQIRSEVETLAYSKKSHEYWQAALDALMEDAEITKVDFTS